MKTTSILKTFTVTLATFLFLRDGSAQNAPVRALVSNGVKSAIEELRPTCERTGGRTVTMQFGSTAQLRQKIDGGEPFDVLIVTSQGVEDLIRQGKAKGPATGVARAGIGIGIRTDAKKPNIRTADAVKQTLLEAKSISYVGDGASRPFVEKMVADLGITDRMKSKTILQPDIEKSIADVASGKAELWITLISEILPAKGVAYLGPVPQQFQNYVSFSAAVGSKAADAGGATAFIRCVTGQTADAAFTTKGLERVK